MIDRLFLAALTFCLLVGGTLAVGSEMFAAPSRSVDATVVATLPRVVVMGKKLQAAIEVVNAQGAASNDVAVKSMQ